MGICCSKGNSETSIPNKNIPNNIPQSNQQLNKSLCESIFRSLPKRQTTDLQSFKDNIKIETNQLPDKEKAYVLFLWVCDNIVYDADSYFAGRETQCESEDIFRNGITVCWRIYRIRNSKC